MNQETPPNLETGPDPKERAREVFHQGLKPVLAQAILDSWNQAIMNPFAENQALGLAQEQANEVFDQALHAYDSVREGMTPT